MNHSRDRVNGPGSRWALGQPCRSCEEPCHYGDEHTLGNHRREVKWHVRRLAIDLLWGRLASIYLVVLVACREGGTPGNSDGQALQARVS
jgi:hypothetical protein